MKLASAIGVAVLCLACAGKTDPLTQVQVDEVANALRTKDLSAPKSMEVRSGFVVSAYELDEAEVVRNTPLRAFAESRLLAIREVLLPYGYVDYRVDINGPPPGTGLIRRYGSSRYINGGTIEWLKP